MWSMRLWMSTSILSRTLHPRPLPLAGAKGRGPSPDAGKDACAPLHEDSNVTQVQQAEISHSDSDPKTSIHPNSNEIICQDQLPSNSAISLNNKPNLR